MKKLFPFVIATVLGTGMALAQTQPANGSHFPAKNKTKTTRALNPQPLPPGRAAQTKVNKALNPQPLPPGMKTTAYGGGGGVGKVDLANGGHIKNGQKGATPAAQKSARHLHAQADKASPTLHAKHAAKKSTGKPK